jgi:hypothetical protein
LKKEEKKLRRVLRKRKKRPNDKHGIENEMIKETIRGLVALEDQKK